MTAVKRTAAAALLLALGLLAVGLQGCSGSDSSDVASTPNATAVKQSGGGAGMVHPMAAPPGVKTGDFTGGRK